MKNNKNNKNNLGFTIIELMVTILIISILSSIIINRITQSQAQSQADLLKVKIFSGTVKNRLIENLVAEWTLDDTGATIVNTSDYGADLNCTSYNTTPQTSANCINNGCLLFNGSSSYLNCGNNASLNLADAITVEAWAKPTGPHKDGYGGIWFDQYGGTRNRILVLNNGSLLAQYTIGGVDRSPTTTAGLVPLNQFTHIVLTYNGTEIVFWVNGIKQTPTVATGKIALSSSDRQIGRGHATTYYFNGLIDEVRIYNAPLTIVEIQNHYYAGLNKLLAKGAITQLEYNQRVSALQAEFGYK